jgi:hypothetical protein
MKEETGVDRDETQINGRTEGPFGTDDTDVDVRAEDNKNRADQEDSANGLDSLQVRGGQDGRNNRGIGSTDMDGKNGILRMGDQDNSTMEVPEEALNSAAASESKTNTSTVDVTTSGPDDYASADEVDTPQAEKAAKEQDQEDTKQEERQEDVAETGTDLNNQPTY